MIFLEKLESRLTLAILLKDELSPDKKAFGDLFLTVPIKRKNIIMSSEGYFLLMDLPEMNQIITGGGEYYKNGSLMLNYMQGKLFADNGQIDPKNPITSMTLSPSSRYPFPEGMTILKGRLIDTENEPINQASIKVMDMAQSTVSEDGGGYFIHFTALDADKTVTLDINKEGYKPAKQSALLKKGATMQAGTIILTRLQGGF